MISDLPRPEVNQRLLRTRGWERDDQMTDEQDVADLVLTTVTAYTRTDIYEKAELRERVKEDTLGNFDEPLASFFASRTQLDPSLDSIPGSAGFVISQAKDMVKEMFIDQMEDQGLTNIRPVGTTTLDVETGQVAEVFGYSAEFEYSGMSFPISEGEELQIPGGSMDILGEYAIWHNGEYLIVAGGAIPAENYDETLTETITDAIEVRVRIDLSLNPRRLHRELRRLEASVR